MTAQAQPGKYGDYLHALAARVLFEERMLQPRRTGLFETEFTGSSDIEEVPVLSVEVSPAMKTAPSAPASKDTRIADDVAGVPMSIENQPVARSRPTRPAPVEEDQRSGANALRIDTARPRPEPDATMRMVTQTRPREKDVRVVDGDIQSPALLKPALLPADDVRVSMPAPLRSPAGPVAVNAEKPSVIAAHGRTVVPTLETGAAGRTSRLSSRPEPMSGAMVAHALPEMRTLAPLFPPSPQAAREAPAVEITIGRIELRATAAKAPAASPQTAAPSPRHTLQEYLSRKTGGSR